MKETIMKWHNFHNPSMLSATNHSGWFTGYANTCQLGFKNDIQWKCSNFYSKYAIENI